MTGISENRNNNAMLVMLLSLLPTASCVVPVHTGEHHLAVFKPAD